MSGIAKKPKSIIGEIKKWESDRSDTKIILYNKHDNNEITFICNGENFKVVCPVGYPDNNSLSNFHVEYENDTLNWLGYVNLYCTTKRPTKLSKVLKKLDEYYKKYVTDVEATVDSIDEENFYKEEDMINSFDIEISKMKHKLSENIPNCFSMLQMEKTDNKVQIFKGDTPSTMILNEYIALYTKYNNDNKVQINVVDDNIYHWKLRFKNFNNTVLNTSLELINNSYDYNYIELDIHFHNLYYPVYPPVIKYIRPRLNKFMMHKLSNLKMIQQDYWTPTRKMEYVVSKLYSIIEKYADVNTTSEMNSLKLNPCGSYLDIESNLIKLSSFCGIDDTDTIDTTTYNRVYGTSNTNANTKNVKSSTSKAWVSGTGFGTSGSSEWDIKNYIKLEQEKELQVRQILQDITNNIQSSTDFTTLYSIINGSYLISYIKSILEGATLLDISKKNELYKIIFTILQNLVTEDSIFIFHSMESKSIMSILSDLSNKAHKNKQLLLTNNDNSDDSDDMTDIIISLYDMAKPCYDIYVDNIKTDDKDKHTRTLDDIENKTENDIYVEALKDQTYNSCDLVSGNFKYKAELGKETTISKSTLKRIGNEYSGLMDSMPIHRNASIFFRNDENNLRACRVLITGPDNTPYDSGVFIFDIIFPSNYPNSPPTMNIVNQAGQRLNPNLYACGKVCLSLLGTWSGTNGETWNKDTSTLYQVLNSIQSLILIDEPYYNEPSYEKNRSSTKGQSDAYTDNIRYYVVTHNINDMLSNLNIYPEFKEVIENHFRLKKDYILKVCSKWTDESKSYKAQMKVQLDRMKELFSKL